VVPRRRCSLAEIEALITLWQESKCAINVVFVFTATSMESALRLLYAGRGEDQWEKMNPLRGSAFVVTGHPPW